ncbi:MAG: SGNH/GDSL hydrolase family protein [Pseudomonadota bacterium]|nr:SGNH/GDSL hydrolase family protein [Pseudomonadota bacterium]
MQPHITLLRSALAAALCVMLAAMAPIAAAAQYTSLFVLGDSLSDTGNLSTGTFGLVPGPSYWNGRFSDGPVYAEYLAADLGLAAPAPSLTGGQNYAWGGAKIASGAVPPSLGAQAGLLLLNEGGTLDPGALYTVWGGANDVLDLVTAAPSAATAQAAINGVIGDLMGILDELSSAGAAQFLVPNLPDLSLTPAHFGNPLAADLSDYFNAALADALQQSTLQVSLFDTYSVLNSQVSAFTSPFEPCIALSSCEGHLFFDGLHPTTAAHEILAGAMHAQLTAVPVPGAIGLFGSAIAATVWLGKRRRG